MVFQNVGNSVRWQHRSGRAQVMPLLRYRQFRNFPQLSTIISIKQIILISTLRKRNWVLRFKYSEYSFQLQGDNKGVSRFQLIQ